MFLTLCIALHSLPTFVGQVAHRRQAGAVFKQKVPSSSLRAAGVVAKMEPEMLTAGLKNARTPGKLLNILNQWVDSENFNDLHAAAAYDSLVKFGFRGWVSSSVANSRVLSKLDAGIAEMMKNNELSSRSSSTLLRAMAHLYDRLPALGALLPSLARFVAGRTDDMNTVDLSMSFWATAKLKEAEPEVLDLAPPLAQEIAGKVQYLNPQDLSNCLWSSTQLIDVPEVREIVPVLVRQLLLNADSMKELKPKTIGINLVALTFLRESVPEVQASIEDSDIFELSASHIARSLLELRGKDVTMTVPTVLWACAKSGLKHPELLRAVSGRFGSSEISKLRDWSLCAMQWSYEGLEGFRDFQETLASERDYRGLSDEDMEKSQVGPTLWVKTPS